MSKLSAGREASPGGGVVRYERHHPEHTLLYQLVEEYYPALKAQLAAQGTELPAYVQREFEAYLNCGRLERGFLRLRCDTCHGEHLLAFSCKRRGFCPSCGARRMAESAALLVDEVFPEQPVRQWVLSFPYPLRFLFASRPAIMGRVLGIVYRVIATRLIKKAGSSRKAAHTGAVTLIQRFGSVAATDSQGGSARESFRNRVGLANFRISTSCSGPPPRPAWNVAGARVRSEQRRLCRARQSATIGRSRPGEGACSAIRCYWWRWH